MFGARFYCALTLHVLAPIGGHLQVLRDKIYSKVATFMSTDPYGGLLTLLDGTTVGNSLENCFPECLAVMSRLLDVSKYFSLRGIF
jgi:hypothetical protein